ncbi:MAG: hypothetical protein PUF51_06130 [Bifidobacteriaceae bacterium]|nr:hypothetical protein [Bifidobacteriaceae bacterium]
MELFDASVTFPGFVYPPGLKKVAELGLDDLDIWFIMDAPFAQRYCESINKRYPNRQLVPFAKREDCDDVACFEIGKPGKVEIVHDFASPGWERRGEYDDFWEWFTDAVKLLVERSREDEAYDAAHGIE